MLWLLALPLYWIGGAITAAFGSLLGVMFAAVTWPLFWIGAAIMSALGSLFAIVVACATATMAAMAWPLLCFAGIALVFKMIIEACQRIVMNIQNAIWTAIMTPVKNLETATHKVYVIIACLIALYLLYHLYMLAYNYFNPAPRGIPYYGTYREFLDQVDDDIYFREQQEENWRIYQERIQQAQIFAAQRQNRQQQNYVLRPNQNNQNRNQSASEFRQPRANVGNENPNPNLRNRNNAIIYRNGRNVPRALNPNQNNQNQFGPRFRQPVANVGNENRNPNGRNRGNQRAHFQQNRLQVTSRLFGSNQSLASNWTSLTEEVDNEDDKCCVCLESIYRVTRRGNRKYAQSRFCTHRLCTKCVVPLRECPMCRQAPFQYRVMVVN